MTEEETNVVETPQNNDETEETPQQQEEETPSVNTVDLWITTTSVINFHGLKPKQFGLEKTNTTGLETMLTDWISQCQDMINRYTDRNYTSSTVPGAVQNVLLRLVSNMCTLAIQRRDSPIIKVNDWNITTLPSDIFSDDLKEDLKPFIKNSSNDYSKIGFFAITGKDDDIDGGSNC